MQSLKEMEMFFEMISPSIKMKVLMIQFKNILNGSMAFKGQEKLIDDLLFKL